MASHRKIASLVTFIRRIGPVAIGISALVVTIAWLSGAFENKIEPGRSASVPTDRLGTQQTDVVHEITKPYIEEAIGTLKAASRTVVSARVLATIREITVTAGDHVEEGDLLVRLDSSALEARQQQAQQALVSAVAVRKEAQINYDRIKRLVAKESAAGAERDRAESNLGVANANVERAEHSVREANVLLSYATIKASKAGRVVDRQAEPGDTARPGEPLLVLYDATSLRLEAPVQEHLAVKLRAGEKLNVFVDAITQEVEATVDEIVPQADAPSRSFLVKASVPRSDNLYEGMFGRLRIPAGTRRHLCLATAAIQKVGQLEFVEVVLADDTVERRFIKTGRLGLPERIEVLSGLRAGERVILHQPVAQTTESPKSGASSGDEDGAA